MSRALSSSNKNKAQGLELFSEMMLMKFKPKSIEASKKAVESPVIRKRILGNLKQKMSAEQQDSVIRQQLNRILYLELASRDTVILGNYNQLDMIDLDGLTHSFVDTFHYWSFYPGTPIMDLKVNPKKQVMLIYSLKTLLLYTYDALKKENNSPEFVASIQLKEDISFMHFPTTDFVAVFYISYFEIYSVSDSNIIQKKLEKKYNIQIGKYQLFAVPEAVDNTINIFFEEKSENAPVFGLWCIEVNISSENIRQNPPYKVYDIMNSLKSLIRIQNYSRSMIFLNLGQEILFASKGYIVDSVNINIQVQSTFLRLFPQRNMLLHIQQNLVEIYSFKLNLAVYPHRIELKSIDSVQISDRKANCKLLKVLPVFQNNFAIFYEQQGRNTTRGEIFYSFMMSYTVKLQEKINRILHSDIPLSEMDEAKMEIKCDILRKIGLKDEEIYLQIWKRSSQSLVVDYQYLLSTRHYKTIKTQIESKMKKTSMKFKEIVRIQESCLQILSEKINNQSCTKEDLKDYITCHLLIRKLKLFKQIQVLRSSIREDKGFYINIQQYYNFKNTELKQFVLSRISQFISTGTPSVVQIRTILYHFRFVYRLIYADLLEQMIKITKGEFIKVLQAIPELLPIDFSDQLALEQGVWKDISANQWENSLYLEKIMSINNKNVLAQLIEDVWFKRNYLTVHDMISLSNEEIKSWNKKNNSIEIFYFFIEKMCENIKEKKVLSMIFHYVENNYVKFPSHLKSKVLLYSKLYDYHSENRLVIKSPKITFAKFLTLRDFDLFKLFFQYEKVKKNCILKQIQPMYSKIADEGQEIFNQSLLNYFKSDISELSHLKYLLNRVNNEKQEFHSAHQSMYGVLVKAMQIKLVVGSGNDVPIDQVLIYLENIPITSNQSRQIIKDLELIQRISEECEILKSMRVNMTLRQIIDSYEAVMQKLVDYEVDKFKIMSIDNYSFFMSATYRLLAEVQSFKKNIYDNENELAFFIYLTKLMEKQDKLPLVNILLNDQYINNYFYIDLNIIENLVQYMYKWKFSENSSFSANRTYIQALLQLLPPQDSLRKFIQRELQFALLLSSPKEPVRYPIAADSPSPRVEELEDIIKSLENQFLCGINIDEVIILMKSLRQLSKEIHRSSIINGNHISIIESSIKMSAMDAQWETRQIKDQLVYEAFIKTYITKGLIKEVLPLIRRSIELSQKYDVISILILIYHFIEELNEQSKVFLIKIISYLYQQPFQLLNIVQKLLNTSLTCLESIKFLKEEYMKVRNKYLNYNPENIVFNLHFLQLGEESEVEAKKALVKNTLIKLKKGRPELTHDFLFDILYIIVCFQPHSLGIFLKFVGVSKYKLIRSFFSHLILEQIFDEMNMLELLKRSFYLLLKSLKDNIDIYHLVRKYSQISLVQQFPIQKYESLSDFEKKVKKNYINFDAKKNKLKELTSSNRLKKSLALQKEVSIRQSIKNPQNLKQKQPNQYVFSDSDDDYQKKSDNEEYAPHLVQKRSKQSKIVFDRTRQRRDFYRHAPIRSREEIAASKSGKHNNMNALKEKQQLKLANPIEDLKSSRARIKKYFSKDVRSKCDQEEDYQSDSLFKDFNIKDRSNSKESLANYPSPPENPLSTSQHLKPDHLAKTNRLGSFSSKPAKLKSVHSADMEHLLIENSWEKGAEELLVDNKLSEEDEKSLKNAKIDELPSQSPIVRVIQQKIQDIASEILSKIYKTYSPRLQAEPYSLKALLAYRAQKQKDIPRIIALMIDQIYEKPERSIQVALNLLMQIGSKFPQSDINLAFAEIYKKIAKLQSKYGLDLPLQKMLPLSSLVLKSSSPDELFQTIKNNINSVCDSENIFKIAKLLSIGFRRNNLEEQIIAYYLQKQIIRLDRQIEQEEEIEKQLQKIKGLLNKLKIRLLLQISDPIIKKTNASGLKKRILQCFVDVIRLKGNAKEAKELSNRYK